MCVEYHVAESYTVQYFRLSFALSKHGDVYNFYKSTNIIIIIIQGNLSRVKNSFHVLYINLQYCKLNTVSKEKTLLHPSSTKIVMCRINSTEIPGIWIMVKLFSFFLILLYEKLSGCLYCPRW
jgi:hypothetical protein